MTRPLSIKTYGRWKSASTEFVIDGSVAMFPPL